MFRTAPDVLKTLPLLPTSLNNPASNNDVAKWINDTEEYLANLEAMIFSLINFTRNQLIKMSYYKRKTQKKNDIHDFIKDGTIFNTIKIGNHLFDAQRFLELSFAPIKIKRRKVSMINNRANRIAKQAAKSRLFRENVNKNKLAALKQIEAREAVLLLQTNIS